MRFAPFAPLLVALAFVACDKIDAPYLDPNVQLVDCADTLPPPSGSFFLQRKVLLEDYTGFLCGNCPAAARDARVHEQTFGEQLVVMAVHAGDLATPTPEHTDNYLTTVGTELDAFFGITRQGIPRGMVNRAPYGGVSGLKREKWGAAIAEQAAQAPQAAVQLSTKYNAETKKLQIRADVQYLTNTGAETDDFLVLYLTEDSIVGFQKEYNPDTNYTAYVQRHMLRGSVNGTWGDQIGKGAQTNGARYAKHFCYELSADWKPEHMEIVAVLYRKPDRNVLQVEEKAVVE